MKVQYNISLPFTFTSKNPSLILATQHYALQIWKNLNMSDQNNA